MDKAFEQVVITLLGHIIYGAYLFKMGKRKCFTSCFCLRRRKIRGLGGEQALVESVEIQKLVLSISVMKRGDLKSSL